MQQSQVAVFLEDELAASPGVSAVAPAVFVADTLTRFTVGASRPGHSQVVLLAGALAAGVAGAMLAVAALSGVLFP